VQIDPVEQARALAASARVDPRPEASDPLPPVDGNAQTAQPLQPLPPASGQKYAWFWDKVQAGRSQSDDRFPLALAALNQGPDGASVWTPRLQPMQEMADAYGTDILKATVGTRVSPALVLAMMAVESGGNPKAQSSAGAQGLMQLIPDTAARFGVTDALDPGQSIKGGVAYLDWLMGNFDRDPVMVIAAYNAGEGAVAASDGVPPYAETRDYVPKVLAAWTVAQGLCLTPPMLVSDPCVFRVVSAQNTAQLTP
jgi:soluble lytic murein transglycosylase-like protein